MGAPVTGPAPLAVGRVQGTCIARRRAAAMRSPEDPRRSSGRCRGGQGFEAANRTPWSQTQPRRIALATALGRTT